MEQEREINRLQQLNLAFERSNISSSNSRNSFYKPSPNKFAPSDISTGVKRLSIGGEENNHFGGGGGASGGASPIFTTIQSIALILLPPLPPLLLVLVLALVLVLELELELVWVFQDPLIVSVLV